MNKNEKRSLKNDISKNINLGNSRYTDDEISKLKTISDNASNLNGKTWSTYKRETVKDTRGNWDSETRTTYTARNDSNGFRVDKHTYVNNDGYEFNHDTKIESGKEIAGLFNLFFKK